MNLLSRRQFIATSALTAAALSIKPNLWAKPGDPSISVQLYSVRNDCAKDFDTTLAQLAKMGFTGVEFAGYHKYAGKPKELRAKLDELNLKAAATHIGTASFRGDKLQETIDFHQTIGCKYLVVPGDGDFTNPDKCKALAEFFDKTAQTLKPLGLACGYHNHSHEFKKNGATTFWEQFAESTTKDVVLQMDVGWVAAANYDPVALIKRYPGRTQVAHFKPTVVGDDKSKKAILGQDSVDWKSVLAACRQYGAIEWVTVEQEVYPDGKSPMECTELSLAGLKKIW